MAVKMVRQPSETPNISNIDDFVGLRYAYANQNGYVKGRGNLGTGIDTDAYTVNGNTFTINSGRLVLQGVESDVETNGHSIIIDISGTKKYYAVYLEVNLSTNTSDIFVKSDTVGIPNIDGGDDLTVYTNGTARMVLFTFEATNGIISNIVKVIKPCEYSRAYRDENGVLKYGDIIVPQKKLLWSGNATSSGWDTETKINLSETVKVGDILEICMTNYNYEVYHKFRVKTLSGDLGWVDFSRALNTTDNSGGTMYMSTAVIKMINNQQFSFTGANDMALRVSSSDSVTKQYVQSSSTTLHSVYKVIE